MGKGIGRGEYGDDWKWGSGRNGGTVSWKGR